MTRPLLLAALLAALPYTLPASAAPLDALLNAASHGNPDRAEVEFSYDVVNDTVDVLRLRDKDDEFRGSDVGDYEGAHIRARLNLTDTLFIDGGFWQRRIDFRNDRADIDSWQVGLQHQLSQAEGWQPALAWRVSAWGNQANSLQKTSPTRVQNVTVDTVSVNEPEDRQAQLDLIASWMLSSQTTWSVFAGGGTSRVKVREITATGEFDGCRHRVSYRPGLTTVTPVAPCPGSTTVNYAGPPLDEFGGDVASNATYRAKYLQAGTSLQWQGEKWRVAGGYHYQMLDRGAMDDRLERQGRDVHETNHTVIGEVRYRLSKHAQLFGRGQVMTNQFVGEIPFSYNSFTAHRFNKRYGFASVGLIVNF